MTDYTSGAINFTGLGNGTDFNQLIDGLVKVEKTRVTRLENWRSSWERKDEQFKSLNTQMLDLKTTLEGFDTINEFMAKSINSTDTSLLTATATTSAEEGSHSIEIGQLATNDVLITASGASSLSDPVTLTTTNFTFSYAGETHTISNIGAGVSLGYFVNIINSDPNSKDCIRASTIFDGSLYHLQLEGVDPGADNQLVISNAGDLLFKGNDFNESRNATNSQIRVNGFPSSGGGWIERSTNSINDVINGITLNLNNAAVGTETKLNIVTDTSKIKANVETFVAAINAIRAQIMTITKVDENPSGSDGDVMEGNLKPVKGSILTGNYGVDIVSQNLRNLVAEAGLGFSPFDSATGTGDKYSALSQIGIMTDAEEGSKTYGLLKINYDTEKGIPGLNDALEKNPQAVAELFAAKNETASLSSDFTFNSIIEGTTKAGLYDVEIVSDGTSITSATINGEPAKVSGWDITGISGDALGMGLHLNNPAAGTYSGQVSIKTGKVGEMIEELKGLTKPYNQYTYEGGPMAVLQENYADIMESIDNKIDYENTRISKIEANLKLKFARLDSLLGQYTLKQGQLTSSINQLSS